MIAAAYTNPNWDGKENAEKRSEYIRDINKHFNAAITRIYYPDGPKEQEIDWDNPFYAAHKREIERTRELINGQLQGRTAGEVLELEDERAKRREGYDQ